MWWRRNSWRTSPPTRPKRAPAAFRSRADNSATGKPASSATPRIGNVQPTDLTARADGGQQTDDGAGDGRPDGRGEPRRPAPPPQCDRAGDQAGDDEQGQEELACREPRHGRPPGRHRLAQRGDRDDLAVEHGHRDQLGYGVGLDQPQPFRLVPGAGDRRRRVSDAVRPCHGGTVRRPEYLSTPQSPVRSCPLGRSRDNGRDMHGLKIAVTNRVESASTPHTGRTVRRFRR
jgi:hypothetical protein